MTKSDAPFVPVLIVTFRNTLDVLSCLRSVARLQPGIIPVVYLCENGGLKAFGDLVGVLTGPDGGCVADGQEGRVAEACLSSVITLQRKQTDAEAHITIHVGCAVENLGYAGGINAWLRPLSALPNWNGAWILNPDTEPEPAALHSLIQYVEENGTGMVGSRLMSRAKPQLVHCRGLAWDFVRGSTRSVDMFVPASVCFPPEEQDRRLDSPSGASIYITRACLDQIGPMDERYFLYFEDLDWGLKAKKCCGVGYAHKSIVMHTGGTTIGTATSRRNQSPLAVYLDFRNRVIFVRAHFPNWLPWTIIVALAHLLLYVRTGRPRVIAAAVRGLWAGLRGRTGRPDDMMLDHLTEHAKQGHGAAS